MTKVKFYMEGENSVFAYFPEIIADQQSNRQSYVHLGQHSACHPDYVKGKKLADYSEYNGLLRELIGQGYNDLQILNNHQEKECHRLPTKGEIKFGEGAIHWLTVPLNLIINNKTGELKKWFIHPKDRLRYYTS